MSVVKQTGTGAEVRVRAIVSSLGIRFRLDNADLPGSPDLANRSRRWAIFVHGCFWHAHSGCRKATLPKRNRAYWIEKFATNKARDALAIRRLRSRGYEVLRVWECQLAPSRVGSLKRRLAAARERLISARAMQGG
ncbi:MAG: very short patch repair endonuclease [Gemmatimonadota bacterium]|nr:very short patch repair endonuclease [Gemmatimonadota bacterium]